MYVRTLVGARAQDVARNFSFLTLEIAVQIVDHITERESESGLTALAAGRHVMPCRKSPAL
jgi:hypothetical protein